MSGGAHLSLVRTRATAAAVLLLTLVGCGVGETKVVDVSAPALNGSRARLCTSLEGALPSEVADMWQRDVTTEGVAAAWGAPPIVLRCGVTDAEGLGPAVRCDVMNGVGWYSEDIGDGYRFTTIGRATPVELTVPDEYAPEADAAVDVAAAINQAIPLHHPCV
ncbi:MAG: DUF3515 family protein [Nocardioidaceae bacterium]